MNLTSAFVMTEYIILGLRITLSLKGFSMYCGILQNSVKKYVRYLAEFIIQQVIMDLTSL